jgi:hypothetical protein
VFAAIVDKSCVYWITRSCTGNKTCRLYNNKMFSLGLGLLGSGFRFMSAMFALITLIVISRSGSFNLDNNKKLSENSDNNTNKNVVDSTTITTNIDSRI